MTILSLFIDFINKILTFKFLNIEIIDYLKIFAVLGIIFAIIKAMSNDMD
mgnify:CR=1 FL=1